VDQKKIGCVIHKGTDKNIDSYSTFFDNGHRKSTGLEKLLRGKGAVALIYAAELHKDRGEKEEAKKDLKAALELRPKVQTGKPQILERQRL